MLDSTLSLASRLSPFLLLSSLDSYALSPEVTCTTDTRVATLEDYPNLLLARILLVGSSKPTHPLRTTIRHRGKILYGLPPRPKNRTYSHAILNHTASDQYGTDEEGFRSAYALIDIAYSAESCTSGTDHNSGDADKVMSVVWSTEPTDYGVYTCANGRSASVGLIL